MLVINPPSIAVVFVKPYDMKILNKKHRIMLVKIEIKNLSFELTEPLPLLSIKSGSPPYPIP